ncbi:MAG: helix-turn-helix domain-containing protein [Solirubrobacteraceae bacterium]|nr:helix-turn-helix domain-containing protein [Patulibacter sp.]
MAELLPDELDLLDRRRRAVRLVEQGRSYAQAGQIVGLNRNAISRAVHLHATGGDAALVPRPRGRKPLLSEEQHARLARVVHTHRPNELGLDGRHWTRATAAALVEREIGVRVSDLRAGIWLNRWGAPRLRGRPLAESTTRASRVS